MQIFHHLIPKYNCLSPLYGSFQSDYPTSGSHHLWTDPSARAKKYRPLIMPLRIVGRQSQQNVPNARTVRIAWHSRGRRPATPIPSSNQFSLVWHKRRLYIWMKNAKTPSRGSPNVQIVHEVQREGVDKVIRLIDSLILCQRGGRRHHRDPAKYSCAH